MNSSDSYRRGDIFYANLSPSSGSEQNGTRPVIILQNDMGNRFSPTLIVAPISSKMKRNLPTHVPVEASFLSKRSCILLEQIRVIDKTRIVSEKLGTADKYLLEQIDRAIRISLGLSGTGI